MKAFLMGVLAALVCMSTIAHAETYPVLDNYKAQVKTLITQTEAAKTEAERAALVQATEALISSGTQVMDLYASKNPVCAAQFKALEAALPQLEAMTLEQLAPYIHGTGLPDGAKHCYFARTTVVRPVMNLVRLQSKDSLDSVRDDVSDDWSETIEHFAQLVKNVDTPPAN